MRTSGVWITAYVRISRRFKYQWTKTQQQLEQKAYRPITRVQIDYSEPVSLLSPKRLHPSRCTPFETQASKHHRVSSDTIEESTGSHNIASYKKLFFDIPIPLISSLLAPLCLANVATAHLAAFTDRMFCPGRRHRSLKYSRLDHTSLART